MRLTELVYSQLDIEKKQIQTRVFPQREILVDPYV